MKSRTIFIVAVGFAIFSCNNGRNSHTLDEVSGIYVRELSFKVINPETGNAIGMRTIRDTIFIQLEENSYEVSNNKWKLNDYDQEGWQNMEHSEDGSMPTFKATFNLVDRSLESESMPRLFLDLGKRQLHKGKGHEGAYQKLK